MNDIAIVSNTDFMCLYVFIWEMCVKYEVMMIVPTLYVWDASWNMCICIMCHLKPWDDNAWNEVQMYNYEKWWNVMYMKNDDYAKHAI